MKCQTAVTLIIVVTHCVPAPDAPEARLSWLASLKLLEMPADNAPLVCVPVSATAPAGEKLRVGYAFGFIEEDDGTSAWVRLVDFSRIKANRKDCARYDLKPEDVVRKLTGLEAARLWTGWLDTKSNDRLWKLRWNMEEFAKMIVLAAVLQHRGETVAGSCAGWGQRAERQSFRDQSLRGPSFNSPCRPSATKENSRARLARCLLFSFALGGSLLLALALFTQLCGLADVLSRWAADRHVELSRQGHSLVFAGRQLVGPGRIGYGRQVGHSSSSRT